MSDRKESLKTQTMQKSDPPTCTQRTFMWLLMAFTVVLIFSSVIELVLTFVGLDKNKKAQSTHGKKILILGTLEVIFLVIEIFYYFYGLYNIYYQKYHSILCFGLSTMALTLVQAMITLLLGGNPYQLAVHGIELVYTLMVSVYGYLLVANFIQPAHPHNYAIPPPAHPPPE